MPTNQELETLQEMYDFVNASGSGSDGGPREQRVLSRVIDGDFGAVEGESSAPGPEGNEDFVRSGVE